eukprot:TRINITY_DN10853_c0_g1_i1.p1 TRINITY_DN10853_c0_g1~~TRINITY_DN10853_c0_g1_i1.p1  ORF type:complete len:193 (+),score=36.96 TRINITY_DN10853_c0_g1_i1:130-708(+)
MSNKPVHPFSRKARILVRAQHRDGKLETKKKIQSKNLLPEVEKIRWFRDNLDEEKKSFSLAAISEFIEVYLARFDEELAEIQAKKEKYKGQVQSRNREDILLKIREQERAAFTTTGFMIPDLTKPKNVEILRDWDGEAGTMDKITQRRFKPFVEVEASAMAVESSAPAQSPSTGPAPVIKFDMKHGPMEKKG